MAAKKGFPGNRQAQPRRQGGRRSRRSILKPKGKMNPYACFVRTCREELPKSRRGTEVSFVDFSKHCARRWKALSPREKARFQALARADGRRFAREMRSYDPSMETKAPKKPMSSFLLFCQEYRPQLRAQHPNLSPMQESRRLGAIWRGLSKKEYHHFVDSAASLREKYVKDVDEYKKRAQKMAYARSLGRERVAGKRSREEEVEEEDSDYEESMDD
ncbi:high mobility group protein B3-like [Suncus etruscus]|uniref:high mobility group protein B3-like n=1 Tax=Suncus etruscus TaxID=109475 RepID=UPI00210F7BF0|nr:high mobility group protein B3-like [Suncus etruscus]